MMKLGSLPHRGKEQTGRYMYHFAQDYTGDLGAFRSVPFSMWYDKVGGIPYRSDDELFPEEEGVVEVVARPAYLLNPRIWPALDCKKKAILIGAWAEANNLPFFFVAVSELPSKEIHHVFPMVNFGKGFVTTDATFPEFRIGQAYPVTYVEELKR